MRALIPALAISLVACGVNTEPILADSDTGGAHRQGPQLDLGPPQRDGDPFDAGTQPENDLGNFVAQRVEDPCSDGLPRTCEEDAPECEADGEVATLRAGCWVCVVQADCPPPPGEACAADAAWRYDCPVGDLEAPWCTCAEGGIVECVVDPRADGCCGDGSEIVCPVDEVPVCPDGTVEASQEGCHACVDPTLCTPDE